MHILIFINVNIDATQKRKISLKFIKMYYLNQFFTDKNRNLYLFINFNNKWTGSKKIQALIAYKLLNNRHY